MILDELKGFSDDFSYTEDHIKFLCTHYRSFLLKQRYYSDLKKVIPESNYQTICLDLIEVPVIDGECCEGGSMLRSKIKVPHTMGFGTTKVSTCSMFDCNIAFISRERMKYVGFNKWLRNTIYCTVGPDNYIYLKSWNPQFKYLEKVNVTGIFEDIEDAYNMNCENSNAGMCDIMDSDFPIESALVQPLIELVVKELRASEYLPSDEVNDANDQLDNVNVKINGKS